MSRQANQSSAYGRGRGEDYPPPQSRGYEGGNNGGGGGYTQDQLQRYDNYSSSGGTGSTTQHHSSSSSSQSQSRPPISYPFKQTPYDDPNHPTKLYSSGGGVSGGGHRSSESNSYSSSTESEGYRKVGMATPNFSSPSGGGVGGHEIDKFPTTTTSSSSFSNPKSKSHSSTLHTHTHTHSSSTTGGKLSLKEHIFGRRDPNQLTSDDEKELDEEEREMLRKGMFNWNEMKSWRFWIRKEWIWWYLALVVISVLVILMTLYHKQIVAWLKPVTVVIQSWKFGWLIPIGILFVLSFPPLFGHEIVGVLCGLVWGLWVGFGIVAAGTFLGEMGNYVAFKYFFRAKAAKVERKNLNYALLAHVVREGGIIVASVVRLSAIPGHFSTVVFSTCGLSIWYFIIACIVSMPKQLITVYLGVALESTEKDTKTKIIQDVVLGASFLLTILAAWYIYRKMNKARLTVYRQHRARLAATGMNMDGIPLDPSKLEQNAYGKAPTDDEDVTSPILKKEASKKQSYQNGFDITYRQEQGMSVYGVEDYHGPSSNTHLPLTAVAEDGGRPYGEGDDLSAGGMNQYNAPNYQVGNQGQQRYTSQFPTPKPAIGDPNLRRNVSEAESIHYTGPSSSSRGWNDPPSQIFPDPRPHVPAGGLRRDDTTISYQERPSGGGGGYSVPAPSRNEDPYRGTRVSLTDTGVAR